MYFGRPIAHFWLLFGILWQVGRLAGWQAPSPELFKTNAFVCRLLVVLGFLFYYMKRASVTMRHIHTSQQQHGCQWSLAFCSSLSLDCRRIAPLPCITAGAREQRAFFPKRYDRHCDIRAACRFALPRDKIRCKSAQHCDGWACSNARQTPRHFSQL